MASFYPVYVAAMNLTRRVEEVQLESLVGPRTGCLHDYQMAPDDMARWREADILLLAGAGAEEASCKAHWSSFPVLSPWMPPRGSTCWTATITMKGESPTSMRRSVNEHY